MESFVSEMDIQKFWARRISGAHHDEITTADVLLENQVLFPPAQVQVEDELTSSKSRPSSPVYPHCHQFCLKFYSQEDECSCGRHEKDEEEEYVDYEKPEFETLDAATLGDIPCSYRVPRAESHEMTAVGVYVDPRIVPGFTYRIRRLSQDGKKKWMFGGAARELESVGRGYSRRITLKALNGQINSNPDYFWTDSHDQGFAFSLQVVSSGDKFTLFDVDHQAVAHLELTHLQGPQMEVCQRELKNGGVEKIVRIGALCKVDWFHEQDNSPSIQIRGVCVAAMPKGGRQHVIEVREVRIGQHYGYSLRPGTCSSLRSLRLSGAAISDVPASYTIVGIEPYHFPVIGTYIDERILPGFYYRVQLGGCGKKLFRGQALRLESIGMGYAKRITFQPSSLNNPDNHFWSDSQPEGFGFEISAVRNGMEFTIMTKDCLSVVGHALVFRDDYAPQIELHHSIVDEGKGSGVLKRVQVNVKCEVSLDTSNSTRDQTTSHIMRVSGTAVLYKPPSQRECKVLKIENIGLDSQLNMMFTNELQELVFVPYDKASSSP